MESGYRKAKDSFKYTEEDLLEFGKYCFLQSRNPTDTTTTFKELLDKFHSLKQSKEIKSIEVEYELRDEFFDNDPDHCYEVLSLPILPDGKIKCKINY